MTKECPYCGKETGALKNHVRLAAGNGHGESGEYPPDFNSGSTSSTSSSTSGSTGEPTDGVVPANNQLTSGSTGSSTQKSTDGVDSVNQQSSSKPTAEPVEFPPAPDKDDNEGSNADSSNQPSTTICPECANELVTGEELIEDVQDMVENPPNKKVAQVAYQFLQSNQGVEVEHACCDPWGCGYYIDEGGDVKQFENGFFS